MRSTLVGWVFVAVLLGLVSGCGENGSETPTKNAGGGAGMPTGGSGGTGQAGSSGGATSGGAGSGGAAGTGQSGAAGSSQCTSGELLMGDASCPTRTDAPGGPRAAPTCTAEDAVCTYASSTVSGNCTESTFACCGGMWRGASTCPMPIPNQDPRCPPDLPPEPSLDAPPCTDEGLECGYYPVGSGDFRQQNIGCCYGRWQFCFLASMGPTACACE